MHHVLMSARLHLSVDSEEEAKAWAVVLRTLGMELLGRPTDRISHDGSWTVRAISAEVAERRGRLSAS